MTIAKKQLCSRWASGKLSERGLTSDALQNSGMHAQVLDPALAREAQDFDNVYSSKHRNYDTASQIGIGDHLNMSWAYIPKTPIYEGYTPTIAKKFQTEYAGNFQQPTKGVAYMKEIIDQGKVGLP